MANQNGPPPWNPGQGPNPNQPQQPQNPQQPQQPQQPYYGQGQPPQGSYYGPGQPPQPPQGSYYGPGQPPQPPQGSYYGPGQPPQPPQGSYYGPGQPPQPPQGSYYGPGQPPQPPQGSYYGPGQPPYGAMAIPGAQPFEISSEAKFFQNVYLWMLAGLMVTTFSTYLIFGSDLMFAMLRSKVNCIIVFVVQIGLVMLINFLSEKVSTNVLRGLFLLYAASVGLTISILLLLYPQNVIFKAFLSAAFVYGGMAAYGMYTKKSLEKWGSFLFMALLGLIVSMVINLFARSPMAHYVISWFGVIIFALLTSYDHQKLRVIHAGGFNGEAEEGAMVIHGALTLYLDFINIFIFLVRILGASRD